MLVFVQYEIDSTTEVVEHATVEDFHPKNVADFDGSHTYDVWWSGNDNVNGGYYKAKVLHMTETQEEMDLFLSKRPRKTVNFVEGKGKKRTKSKAAPSAKSLRLEAQSKREEELVSQIEETNRDFEGCGDACKMRQESEKLRLENEKLKRQLQLQESEFAVKLEKSQEDLERAHHLNEQLQEALASKVFASESRIIYARSLDVVVGAEAPVSSYSLASIGAKGSSATTASHTASHTASGLPGPQQYNSGKGIPVVSPATALASVPRTSVAPRCTTELPMPDQIASQDLMLSSTALVEPDEFASQDLLMHSPTPAEPDEFGGARTPPECNEGLQTVIGSARDDGKIYAGSDKWVEKAAWGTLFRASTDSLFCRMATMLYWSPEDMKGRSVTGKLSNKSRSLGQTEAKPPLTPEKVASLKALFRIYMGDAPEEEQKKRLKDVRKHLAQKLGDLRRK